MAGPTDKHDIDLACALTNRLLDLTDKHDPDVAFHALVGALHFLLGDAYGEDVANHFYDYMQKYAKTDKPSDSSEAKFWNLMAEGYDKPIRLNRKAKAARRNG